LFATAPEENRRDRKMDQRTDRMPPETGLFMASGEAALLESLLGRGEGRTNRYRIHEVLPVTGELPAALARAEGWQMVRVMRSGPLEMPQATGAVSFGGMIQHLHYTTAEQRRELLSCSRQAPPPGEDTMAVVIPIRKSKAWWDLAQDERQAHFRKGDRHTAIGLGYADRIFRTLFHARYLGAPSPYDFITYFEFERQYAGAFRELCAELRDPAKNPEWTYVDLEFEIWTTKYA
jgi:hypothetical protein